MKKYGNEYTCEHDSNKEHKCSAGYIPEDTSCPVHPLWHQTIKQLLEQE